MSEDNPAKAAASEAAGPEDPEETPFAEAYTQSLTEVQTKMDRHQRELLQRLNFQDEVGSC
ncbi:PAPL [Symbiodinium pilosum]|uniref:PAPL protein n=1 Tax=Symbiodinium pilosum TaxID=2952 RepID=A0A812RP83_SYMPI|nr:PAPL [Symbiodinium pilosum]